MPLLVIQEPSGGQQTYVLDGPEYVLGRDPSVHIPLADGKVSRKHARIFARDNAYWVEDLGSANGVVINGQPISGPRRLGLGLTIDIGGFQLFLQETSEESAAFSLCGLTEPLANQSFVLPAGELPVGRVDGAIVIPDASVSRRHATLTVSSTAVAVEDHNSSNGTWVNGGRVTSRSLRLGDRVRFGNVEFELTLAGPTTALGVPGGGWAHSFRADRSLQAAVVIGLLAAMLLVITIVVAVRHTPGPPRSNSGRSAEELYFAALEADLASARAATAAEAWQAAEGAYQRVLDRDPINREARRGLIRVQNHRADQHLLDRARTELDNGQADRALATLRRITEGSHYAAAARELAAEAHRMAAIRSLGEARKACRRLDWHVCHRLASRLLEHDPHSVPGQTLISESEAAMRARGVAFTPWAPQPSSEQAPPPASSPAQHPQR